MVILLISSYCKMCTLPTLRSCMFVCCKQYKHARSYCWQWTHFTMGPNEQNQHFAELRQKICLHIYIVVLLTSLPSLDGKLKCFVTGKWQKWLPNSSQTDYNKCCGMKAHTIDYELWSIIDRLYGLYPTDDRSWKSKLIPITSVRCSVLRLCFQQIRAHNFTSFSSRSASLPQCLSHSSGEWSSTIYLIYFSSEFYWQICFPINTTNVGIIDYYKLNLKYILLNSREPT